MWHFRPIENSEDAALERGGLIGDVEECLAAQWCMLALPSEDDRQAHIARIEVSRIRKSYL